MSPRPSIFARLKSENGTLISYYARPGSFTTGGVSSTNADWMKVFSDYGIPNLISAYMQNGLNPLGDIGSKVPIRHFLNHRVFSIPIEFQFLKKKSSLVYLHEGWTLSNFVVAAYCFIHNIPYALMPHGVYEPQIVKTLKWLKLRIFLEKFVIKNAYFVHLYFEGEAKYVSEICKSAKIAIAPTGIDVTSQLNKSWVGDGDYFLYAGRIDLNFKGLDLLVTCWKLAGRSEKLLLAGPDYNGGVIELQNLLRKLGLEEEVVLLGNLNSTELYRLMKHARGFLHISRWESYGRSPIDAILMGVPTLISTQMQIGRVAQISNMAYVTSLSVEDVIEGINYIGELTPQQHNTRYISNYQEFSKFLNWERIMNSLDNQS